MNKSSCYDCNNHGRPDKSGMVDWCRHYRVYLSPIFVNAEKCEGYTKVKE